MPHHSTASRILATGRFVPPESTTNAEIESQCHLEPGWIEQRTGIRQRPTASADHAVSDLAIAAADIALQRGAVKVERSDAEFRQSISMLILATSTPDYLLPPTAPLIAERLRLANVPAFDIAVACSGFLYALQLADSHARVNQQAVLVIGANILTRRCAADDPATAAIFADGAGAAVVVPSTKPGFHAFHLTSDGTGADCLQISAGGSRQPFGPLSFDRNEHLMQVNNGMAVFRYAVEAMTATAQKVMTQSEMTVEDLDFWIPHQANRRIIESVRQRLNIPDEKAGITIDRFANSSAATIPIALDYFLEYGPLKSGDTLLLTAAAAGLTAGACLLRV